MDLSGKVAVVTGGAMGIGYAICEALAALGAAIVIADIAGGGASAEKLAARGFRAAHVETDVSDEDSTVRMAEFALEAFGPIDILVNNAAIYSSLTLKPFEELSVGEWRRMMDVNVLGPFLCCKAALPAFRSQKAGRVINISSAVAFRGNPRMLHYVASKGALLAMTRSLATEMGEHGVQVNAIAPGFTLSDGVNANPDLVGAVSPFALRGRILKRDMVPADIVGAVTFFAGPQAAFITGQTLVVDGGAHFH